MPLFLVRGDNLSLPIVDFNRTVEQYGQNCDLRIEDVVGDIDIQVARSSAPVGFVVDFIVEHRPVAYYPNAIYAVDKSLYLNAAIWAIRYI